MIKNQEIALTLIGLVAIIFISCQQDQTVGVPGGQAAVRTASRGGTLEKQPTIDVMIDGKPHRVLQWRELGELPQDHFETGLQDTQTGYPLFDVLNYLDIHTAQSVTLYGSGFKPVTLRWEEIMKRENKIILGLTHKGTAKIVAGNSAILNRDGWVRHLIKIDVNQRLSAPEDDGRIAEPNVNPLHPRKKSRSAK